MSGNLKGTVNSILWHRKKLAVKIREYVRLQLKSWQRVPWLALQADGRGGYSDDYGKAYKYGLWPILCGKGGGTFFIDCMTGEIVHNVGEVASDDGVISYSVDLDLLDAAKIIARLEKQMRDGDPGHFTKSELDKRASWRESLIKVHDLHPDTYAPKKRRAIEWSFGVD